MKFSTQIKPISHLKDHAAEIIRDISESREPLLITQDGETKLVVLDIKSYEEQEQTVACMRKLLVILNAMMKQDQAWHYEPA